MGSLYNPASNSCSTLYPQPRRTTPITGVCPSIPWLGTPSPSQFRISETPLPTQTGLWQTRLTRLVSAAFPSDYLIESLCCLGWVRGVTNGYTAPWLDIPRSEASPEICKILPDMRLSQRAWVLPMVGEKETVCFLKDFPPSSAYSRYYVRITPPAYSKHYHCAIKEADQSQHIDKWAGLNSSSQILRPPDLYTLVGQWKRSEKVLSPDSLVGLFVFTGSGVPSSTPG